MRLYALKRQQFIPRPLGEVFAFFAEPENLALVTPETLGFQILTPSPVPMKEGALIDYTISVGGLPVRWTTVIASFEPPHRFVDVQLRGPYAYWHHTHTFSETDDGTVMTDEVLYALPLGVLGRWVHAVAVRNRLHHIFAHRSRAIGEIFAARGRAEVRSEEP